MRINFDTSQSFKLLVGCLLATAFSTVASAQIPAIPGWQLSWHDEFDGTAVDTTNWKVLTKSNNPNNEKEYYLPQQATEGDGILRIAATNQPIGSKAFRSARLESKLTFGTGRFEARMDLPTGKGMWPAFWLNANAVQWPLGGEIDIMENRGSEPTFTSSSFHWQKDPGPCCDQHRFVFNYYDAANDNGTPVNFQDGFHTYATEWDPTEVRFYVDDVLYFAVDQTSEMSDANFLTRKNIILNLAVGGDFDGDPGATTTFPQYMDVDYVRVWTPEVIPEPSTAALLVISCVVALVVRRR